jgi:hypothetical protein
MRKPDERLAGYACLGQILAEAVANGADAVEMERDSGASLEVSFMVGNSGAGFVLSRADGNKVIDSLWQEKRNSRGRFRITLHGRDYLVQVQTYDHFGEHAYRLTFCEAKR